LSQAPSVPLVLEQEIWRMGEERRELQKLVQVMAPAAPHEQKSNCHTYLLTASRHSQPLATHNNQIIHWLTCHFVH